MCKVNNSHYQANFTPVMKPKAFLIWLLLLMTAAAHLRALPASNQERWNKEALADKRARER